MNGTTIQVPLTITDRVIMVSIFIMLVLIWILSGYAYLKLPERIPLHFDAYGIADGFGHKRTLLFYAVGATTVVAVLWWMQRNLVAILHLGVDREHPQQYYAMVSRFLRTLALSLLIFVFIVVYRTTVVVQNQSKEFGLNILILGLVIIFTPSLYYLIKAISVRNSR